LTLAEVLERLDVELAEALCFRVMAAKYGADPVGDRIAEHTSVRFAS
jgi:hypothetical protein